MINKIRISFIQEHVKTLLKRMGIVLLFMSFSRLIFYFVNSDSFSDISIIDFFVSIWFDCITICIFFIPIFSLYLFPLPIRENKIYKLFFKILFHLTNSIILFLNLIDVEYFQFTSKRSTFDIFSIVGGESDMGTLVWSFVKDFWILIIIFIMFIIIAEWMYRKAERNIIISIKNSRDFYLFLIKI